MKRLISLILVLLFAFSATACSSTPSDDTAVQSSSGTTTNESVDYENLSLLERLQIDYNSVPDDLPTADYDGYNFRIHTSQNVSDLLGDPDDVSEVVGEALYARSMEIEDRFNVKLTTHVVANEGDYTKYVSLMNTVFLSGEDAFDLMVVWNTTASTFAKQGFLYDMSTISSLDFSKPWFYKDAIDRLSYKGHIFCSVDLMLPIYSSLSCVFFNKELASDLKIGNLYDVVKSGDWTLDYVRDITKDTWYDVNGNGIVERDTDRFGLTVPIASFSFNFMPTFGACIIAKDDADVPYLAASENTELVNDVYTNLRSFIIGNDSVTYDDWTDDPFLQGRSLLLTDTVGVVNSLRDVGFEYGILPVFKYNDAQADYLSAFLPYPSAIPANCSDPERSGVILSAFAAGGYKKVAVAYFETAVKTKYTTDEDSAEMLDIIAGNVTSDGTIMFTDALIYTFMTFAKQNKEFASYWAGQQSSAQKYLENITAAFDGIIA
jgi:ABC-type sugar transport system, periplasmic component